MPERVPPPIPHRGPAPGEEPADWRLRRQPRQARARLAVDSILQAARDIVRTEGPHALTTSRVAERAGVGVGTLYEYFPNREAILARINREAFAAEARQAQAFYADLLDAPLTDLLQEVFTRMVDVDRRMLARVGRFHSLQAKHLEIGRYAGEQPLSPAEMVQGMHGILAAHADEVGNPSHLLVAQLLARGIRAMVTNLLEDDPDLLHDPQLLPTLQRIVAAIVQPANPNASGDSENSF